MTGTQMQTLKNKLASPTLWQQVAYDFRVAMIAAAFIAPFLERATILAPAVPRIEPYTRSIFYFFDLPTMLFLAIVLLICAPLVARKVAH